MKKEKTFIYSVKTFVLFLVYVTVTGCGGGGDKTAPPGSGSTEDKTAPILTLVGSAKVTLEVGADYVEAGATATDDKDGDITKKIVINSSKVDKSEIGDYVVTYNVSDLAGNKATELTRTVYVRPKGVVPIEMKNPWDHGALKVASDKRMLQHEDGTGFFWMADTAWFLYKKTEAEIDLYMNDRARKKFTVIQAIAAHSHASYRTPDYNSDDNFVRSFTDFDITKANKEYWEHIDYMVKKAEEKGMYVALLPVWRDAIMKVERGDVQRTFSTVNDARNYGKWIATRYKDNPNIIWIVGGDAPLDEKWASDVGMTIADQIARWNALGEGIKSVVGSSQLRTFHPGPKVKKPYEVLGKKSWMDFNMIQSSRFGPVDSIKDIKVAIKEGLPAVDGESLYEDLIYTKKDESTRRTAFQIREDAYSQLFVGAFGNTYGHDAIWRFCISVSDELVTGDGACGSKATFLLKPIKTWKEALNADGGKQMQYVTELMKSRPIVGRIPDQSLISGTPSDLDGIVATLGNGYAMVYSAQGKEFTIVMGKVSGATVKAWWYNPRDGTSTLIGEFGNSGTQAFNPPGNPTNDSKQHGNDWVLVLDDNSKGFGTPGQ